MYNEITGTRVYLLGILLMLPYISGYAIWHTVLDHGRFWPHLDAHGHQDTGLVEVVVVHPRTNTPALVSELSEFALLITLVALYRNTTKEGSSDV